MPVTQTDHPLLFLFDSDAPSGPTDDRAHYSTAMARAWPYPSSIGDGLNPFTMG